MALPIKSGDDDYENYCHSVSEVHKLFCSAEIFAKEAEEALEGLDVTAVNQLRYAGHHLLVAFSLNGEDRLRHLERAKAHCERAKFDAIDAIFIAAFEKFDGIERRFIDVLFANQVIPNYVVSYRDPLLAAKDRLAELRQKIYSLDDDAFTRRGFYNDKELLDLYHTARNVLSLLVRNTPVLAHALQEREQQLAKEANELERALEDARQTRRVTWAVGLLGAAATIAAVFLPQYLTGATQSVPQPGTPQQVTPKPRAN